MFQRVIATAALLAAAALAAGCSTDGGMLGNSLTTASVDQSAAGKAPKVDPACLALMSKIDTLRKDGVTERVEKASTGKSATVSVKRESLAKMTELDKANAEFQAKCSTITPKPAQQAAALPAPAPAPPVSTATAADAPPKGKDEGKNKSAAATTTAPGTVPPITPQTP